MPIRLKNVSACILPVLIAAMFSFATVAFAEDDPIYEQCMNQTDGPPPWCHQMEVEGKIYACDRMSFSGGEGGEKKSVPQAVVDRYPSGQKIIIYYDPKHPEKAVLERGLIWKTFMPFIAGLAFLAVAIVCLKAYRRDRG